MVESYRSSAMDKLKSVLSGEEARRDDRTVLETMNEASTLGWATRVKGFIACFVVGAACTVLGVCMLFLPKIGLTLFIVFYTFGNICALCSTMFLMGPVKQLKRMCDKTRALATTIMIKCSSGFYREQIGLNRGQCVPCSCNGLSTECDEHTGNCVNCQFNTTGARCERCKEGYYGNAAKRTCHACPCPFTWSNFALACLDIGSGEVECLCKRGYSGAKCERCAHGYYGNPMVPGGSCKPCNLGNSILNNCDSLNRVLTLINNSMTVPMETIPAILSQTSDSLMVSDSNLRELAALLLEADGRVDRTQDLNLKSHTTTLQHLQELYKDESPLDGAKRELFKKLDNTFHMRPKVDIVTNAEKHAEQLYRAAAGFHQNITDRLRSISQEVERITVANVSVNMDHKLTDAEQTVRNLSVALPTLTNSLAQVEALSKKVAQGANMTDSIRRVKDVIEETRTMVNRLSIATTFNGKGHVELRPPRNLKDIKAFTAIDLLLNQHQKDPSKADSRRRRRQGKHRDGNFFVFYLGNKDASGDYIGMALRNGVLICIYKLGGVVHEVETKSQITTTTSVNSTDLDRVVFHRVYQDAEVNITHKYTSLRPVALSPNHNLPNTIAGVLDLDTDSVVVYVGGHPDEFKPPLELRYPKYRGAMKLSYINDNPVSLFNYKHAVNMDTLQPHIKIPQSEVSDYYDGTGYRMAFIKAPDKKTRRLFRFHTSSRETDALLFYIGNEEDFFCVYVEGGFLVLQGQQAGRELRAQTAERVSLFDKTFAITTAEQLIVQYGPHKISTDHVPTHYRRYYIGGLPEQLRRRHNITAPPLRGCVDHLTADGEIVEYNRTMGVTDGCPLPLLGVCAATLSSALSIDSLFVGGEQPLRVSLGFRTTGTHGTLVRSSSQDLQLSLADGFVVFTCNNYTLKSDKRYSDGSWHYLSAVRRPAGPHFSLDVKTTSSKGLILHVAGTGVVPLMALYMANGKIRMALGQNRIIQHNQKSNDGNWHRVEISVEKSTFHLLVDGVRVPDGHLPNDEGSSLDLHSPVYLGADPKNTKGRYIPINSVTGCIRDFRMNDVAVEEPEATHRILPCPDGLTEMGTYFGGGHIVKDNYFAVGSNFVLSFELRPQYLTGLLFHAESDQASLDVFLMENKVGVKVYGVSGAVSVSVTPHESLCDGQFHMVTVSKLGEVIKLEADSMSEQKALPFMSHSTALDSVYIGGTTKYNQAPVSSPFVGCLRNVRVNERPVAFDTHATVAGP
ncbi:hypothetical protein INR49_008515, partial [Caranx melampygus]